MVIESLMLSLATMVAKVALVGGVRKFIALQKPTLDRVAKTTADAFEVFEGVEFALREWASSEAFADLLERLADGDRDVSDQIITSFIQDGGFCLADDEKQSTAASQIVSFYISVLLNELYQSSAGISLFANRAETLHHTTHGGIEEIISILDTRLPPATAANLVPADPTVSEDISGLDHSELVAKIDAARNLIDEGYVRLARSSLKKIEGEIGSIPDALQFRIQTNLAACALAVEDIEVACALFEKAHEVDPRNPIGIANVAVAAHLKNDPCRAISLANEAREIEPENPQAMAVLLGALWEMGNIDELENLIETQEWVVRDQRCSQVVIGIRMQQSRVEEAISLGRSLIALFPDDAEAHLALSQCLFYFSESERHETGYNDELMARLSEIVTIATRAIELLMDTQLNLRRDTALVVRGSALAIMGETDDALRDFDRVLAENPTNPDAAYNKGLCLLGAGRAADARAAFEVIQDLERREDSLLPLAVARLETGDAAAAAGMLQGTLSLDCPTWNDVHRAEILRRSARDAGLEDPLDTFLGNALVQNPNDPKLLTLSALGRSASGDTEKSDDIFRKALEHASDSDLRVIPEFLAQHYQRQGRFSEAADQLAIVVNGVASHPSAINLLMYLLKSSRYRDALNWVHGIRAADFPTPRIVMDVEVALLLEAGDVCAAVELLTKICSRSDVSPVDLVRLATAQFRCGQKEDARSTVARIKAADLREEPSDAMLLAQLKLLLDVPGHLDDAYMARRIGANDPDVHLGYFAMFQGTEGEREEPTVVGPGCAVLLKHDTTERWWHIEDESDEIRVPANLTINDDLAQRLVGKRVDDFVVLKEGLEDLSYEIAAIQSKFVRAFQETFEEFTTRFPGHPGFFLVSFANDDFSKLYETVDHHDELGRQIKGMYQDGKLPFASFAQFLGRSEIEVWLACTQSGFANVRFGTGTPEIVDAQGDLLRHADSISLDLLALLTVRELALAENLRAHFQRVVVPQHVIDEIQKQYSLAYAQRAPSGWLGKSSQGGYSFSDMSAQGWEEWTEYLRSVLEFAESFDRIASYPLFDVSDRETLDDLIGPHGTGAIFAGEETHEGSIVVVTDDLGLSELARSRGIETVNIQAVLCELLRSKTITDEFYSTGIERLASLNYWFVGVSSDDIVRSLEANSYMTSGGTRAMLKTLAGPDCLEDSAVLVASNLMVSLAGKMPRGQEGLILSAVIETLRRGRLGDGVVVRFRNAIERKLALAPVSRAQLLTAIDLHLKL